MAGLINAGTRMMSMCFMYMWFLYQRVGTHGYLGSLLRYSRHEIHIA
jgi:hypothetical protein